MKATVSSYSFYSGIRRGEYNIYDIPRLASEMGFDAIEFSHFLLPEGDTPVEAAKKLKDLCDQYSLKVTDYAITADFLKCDDIKAEALRLKGELEICKTLGASLMRHDTTYGYKPDYTGVDKSFDGALPKLIEGVKLTLNYAKELGIRTMSENHGLFAQDAVRVEKLVCGVNDPDYGVLLDMGNFMCADDDCGMAVGLLAPYAFHVHAKDFIVKSGNDPAAGGEGWFMSRGGRYLRGTIVGHGEVPILTCLRIIKRAGYDGYVSIEFEGMEYTLDAIRIGKANLEKMFAML